MRKLLLITAAALGISAPIHAEEIKDYTGPFPTQALYKLCSQKDSASLDKCYMYIQGLTYGIRVQRAMQAQGMPVCLPEISKEEARLRILGFVDDVTKGHPQNNKDGGDWIAFMSLSAGNLCKEAKQQ